MNNSTSENNGDINNNNGEDDEEESNHISEVKNTETIKDALEQEPTEIVVSNSKNESFEPVETKIEENRPKIIITTPAVSITPYDSIEAEGRQRLNQETNDFSGSESYIDYIDGLPDSDIDIAVSSNSSEFNAIPNQHHHQHSGGSGGTLSAVICQEEGLADDDSWVEELDHEDLPECHEEFSEPSDFEDISFLDDQMYNHPDLTLHTIYEESGEDDADIEEEIEVVPTELQKYYEFDIPGSSHENQNTNENDENEITDSISETSSTISEPIKSLSSRSPPVSINSTDQIQTVLQKYYCDFDKRDSDGSVGSDSEGNPSPEQRRKKVLRGRAANRHNSLDNLNGDQQLDLENNYVSSDTEVDNDDLSLDKLENALDTVKRTKKKKRSSTPMESEDLLDKQNTESPDSPQKISTSHFAKDADHSLSRTDSFNNWSSDEDTNLMMYKLKEFIKTIFAQQKNSSPMVATKCEKKPPQLVYFESELTRLMKSVPGLKDEQVKEIIEYLSSEDTWSDSYDSSDYTSSELDTCTKNNSSESNTLLIDDCKVPDLENGNEQNLQLVYGSLLSSIRNEQTVDATKTNNSPVFMNKVLQHIGSRLVALMHEVSEGNTGQPTKKTTNLQDEDHAEELQVILPRSKSYDPLLEETRHEASDNERFSWRGSFESALMTGADSRSRLPSTGEASSTLALAGTKQRSAGDLLFKSMSNSREQLDRVRSCGSIGGGIEDKVWSMRQRARNRSGSIPEVANSADDDSDNDCHHNDSNPDDSREKLSQINAARSTTLPRSLQMYNNVPSTTNSLPRLSTSPQTNIYRSSNQTSGGIKSARYRPSNVKVCRPVPAPPIAAIVVPAPYHTLGTPSSKKEYYTKRRYLPQINFSSRQNTGDDGSVSSELYERNGHFIDNISEISSTRPCVSVSRSDSMASVYSGAGEGYYGFVPVRGEVEFSLQYNYKTGDVEIHVIRCLDLASVDSKRNRSDPYVKVYLLPDKSRSGKRKTRVRKHTLNPLFDEVLKYHISLDELELRTLWLSVWHSDIFGRNNFLGEVIVPLANKVFDDPTPKIYMLRERSEILDNNHRQLNGELIVALKFVPLAENRIRIRGNDPGSLHVMIKEAKNLTAAKSNGTSDPFCKSYLLPNKTKSCKQKTPVAKRTCHPIWNHTFSYDKVTMDELSQRCLELTIWDHDRLASNEFLGGIRLSLGTGLHNDKSVDWMDSNNREAALWQRMLKQPNFWVESSLTLRSSLANRNN